MVQKLFVWMYIIIVGHSKICGMLLNAKADYSSADSNGATALHYAAQNNHAKTVEVF